MPQEKPKYKSVRERIEDASVEAARERRDRKVEYDRKQLVRKGSLGHAMIEQSAEVTRRLIRRRAQKRAGIGPYSVSKRKQP